MDFPRIKSFFWTTTKIFKTLSKSVLGVFVVLAVLAGLSFVAYKIYAPIETIIDAPVADTANSKEKLASADQNPNQEEKIPSTGGRVFVFIVLGLALVGVITATCLEKKTAPWSEFLLQPVFVAIAAVFVVNSLVNLFFYPFWRWLWDKQILFWGVNMSIILFAFFKTRKEPSAKFVARIIGFIILGGLIAPVWYQASDALKKYEEEQRRIRAEIARTLPSPLPYKVSAEIALPIIADGESGGRIPGGRKQFRTDKDGNLLKDSDGRPIPVRNPVDGKPGTGAVGTWQINLSDKGTVADLKSLEEEMKKDGRLKSDESLDVEYNEAHNYEAAKYLFNKYGTDPWLASKDYWEPKLAALGYGYQGSDLLNVEAPVGVFGKELVIPTGVYFDWRDSGDAFVVMDQKGSVANYDPSKGIRERLPYPSSRIAFKSLSDKPATVKLKFGKHPF